MDERQTSQEIRDAIIDGDSKKVMSLLTTNPQMRDFMTPFGTWLHVAATHDKRDLVKYLVELGIDVNVLRTQRKPFGEPSSVRSRVTVPCDFARPITGLGSPSAISRKIGILMRRAR
jgi:hypothetical protein